MNGDANRSRLISNGPGYGLPNPPCGIGAEFVAPLIFKFVYGLHQANIALLDQVQELKTSIGIFLSNADDQSEVSFYQFALGSLGFFEPIFDDPQSLLQLPLSHIGAFFNLFYDFLGIVYFSFKGQELGFFYF